MTAMLRLPAQPPVVRTSREWLALAAGIAGTGLVAAAPTLPGEGCVAACALAAGLLAYGAWVRRGRPA